MTKITLCLESPQHQELYERVAALGKLGTVGLKADLVLHRQMLAEPCYSGQSLRYKDSKDTKISRPSYS